MKQFILLDFFERFEDKLPELIEPDAEEANSPEASVKAETL
jgi:hypothetical protein